MISPWTIVITRPEDQSVALQRKVEEAGFACVVLPAIAIEPLADTAQITAARRDLCGGEFNAVLFTSANAVKHLHSSVCGAIPKGTLIGAVGEATAREVRSVWDREPTFLSDDGTGEGLARALCGRMNVKAMKVLVPAAVDGRRELYEYLEGAGAHVTELPLYRTVDAKLPSTTKLKSMFPAESRETTVVALFSPSALRSLWRSPQLQTLLREAHIFSIGKVTSAEAREKGINVWAEAPRPSDEEFVRMLKERCR